MSKRKPSKYMNGWLYAAAFTFLLCAVGLFIMADGCVATERPVCPSMFEYSIDVQVLAVFASLTWPIAIIFLVIGIIVLAVRKNREESKAYHQRHGS